MTIFRYFFPKTVPKHAELLRLH